MKIGILTHYDVNNLGTQLQMYATYHTLLKLGHEPVVLTYNKNYDFAYEQKLRNQVGLRSVPYLMREFLFKKGFRQTWHNAIKYCINRDFRRKHFTFEYYAASDAEAVIVGADEVFSLEVGINMMMYGHGMKTGNLIAYAPAFGQTEMATLERHHARVLIESGLRNFKALSARDQHTWDMISKLTGKEPALVCDPVILYDFAAQIPQAKRISKKYLAIYSYDRNMTDPQEIRAIQAFAKRKGLLTVSIGNYHKWCAKNITCDCLQWLDYMRNAEMVITDTFHGAVVSAILKKETAVMLRSINSNKLSAILRDMKIESRAVSAITQQELERVFSNSTDYAQVNAALEALRRQSMLYLQNAICSCKEKQS